MQHMIAFPGLGLELNINRVAFTVFGRPFYWYGIIIALGFLLGVLYISKNAKRYNMTQDNVFDCVLICVPLGIVCARLYYVIFEWQNYKDNIIDIVKIWNGGIAIYGGVIGAGLGLIIYGKWKKCNILDMCDLAAPGLIIGQCIGRWGNFVNAEAYGSATQLPWRMVLDGAEGVHPTFFYESAWNFIGFLLLWQWAKRRRFSGEIFLGYIAWYGFGRMFIEGLRIDSLYLFSTGLRVSQLLAAITCVVAIYLIVRGYRANPRVAIETSVPVTTPAQAPEEADALQSTQENNTNENAHADEQQTAQTDTTQQSTEISQKEKE